MDTPAPAPRPISLPEDDESFLDDAYARIIDLIEAAQRPDPSMLAADRPHLLPRIRGLIQLARAVSPLQEARPPVLPGYEVLSCLGAGGMGEVFLCRQTKMGGRLVAVKVLSEAFARSSRRLEMLRDEAMALARLRHPGVVDVYEFVVGLDDEDNAVHAFAMQWIQGCSLAQWFAHLAGSRSSEMKRWTVPLGGNSNPTASRAPPPTREGGGQAPALRTLAPNPWMPYPAMAERSPLEFACRVVASVAHTVHAVHREGLLHRDLKPSNILLREDGSALVCDFGLARDMREETADEPSSGFSGTRAFASPEQRRGEPLNVRSDIFSLGMTLRHVVAETLPADLGAVIARATAPAPEHRYDTTADFADDIERFLAHRPVRANPPSPLRRCAMFFRRNRRATFSTSLGALCALVLAGAIVTAVFIAPRRAESHVTRARLELLSPGHANAIWNAEWYRQPSATFELASDARTRAADAYRAALRWRPWGNWSNEVRRELAVVEGAAVHFGDVRLSGLAAYLSGDSSTAIEAWTRLAARQDPDAFIDAALGVLYLVREQHALAYPRLEHAVRAFPKVGFLAAYHADAAVGCGDLDRAGRLLDEAAHFDNQDNRRAALRVRADLLLAQGKLEEALEALLEATLEPQTIADTQDGVKSRSAARQEQVREALNSPIAASRLARIRAARGEYDIAASALGSALARGMGPPSVHAEFTRYVERWWESLSVPARRHAIRRSMDLDPGDPASLAFRLRHTGEGDSANGVSSAGNTPPLQASAGCLMLAIRDDFVALARPDSHTSLERVSRSEIARRLEVWNLERWNTIAAYSETMNRWQLIVWQSPLPRTGSQIIECLHRGRPRPIGRTPAVEAGSAPPAPK